MKTIIKKRAVFLLVGLIIGIAVAVSCGKSSAGSSGFEQSSDGGGSLIYSDGGGSLIYKDYCVVTFDSNGGTETKSVKVSKGEKIDKPAAPVKKPDAKKEYTFIGWYLSDEKWDFEYMVVTEDITLTAHYKETLYSIEVLPSK